jgi:transmembrane sensor
MAFPTEVDDREAIAREATAWFVRLSNPLVSEDDRRAFQHWLAADPAHAAALNETRALWGRLDAPARHLGQSGWHRAPKDRSGVLLRLAASIAIFITIGGGVLWRDAGLIDRLLSDYAVPPGARQEVALSDGTKILLDGGSAVRATITETGRDIEVLRGRVFFDVARDETRPFRVNARQVDTEVLGTGFSVDNESATVIVEHGLVAVRDRTGSRVQLQANQRIAAKDGHLGAADIVAPETAFAWRQGLIVLDSAPLGTVADELERMSPGRVVIPDAELRALTLSGTFRADNPDAVLEAMRTALGLKIVSLPGIATLVYR